MSTSRRDELKRTVFGRDSTAQERASAVEELRLLDETARRGTEPIQSALPDSDHSDLAPALPNLCDNDSDSDSDETPALPHVQRVRAIWLLPIILASVAIGAIGGAMWRSPTSSTTSTSKPSAPAPSELALPAGGSLTAADTLFQRKRTAQDTFPVPDLLPNLRQSSVRLLGGSTDAVRLWAGRDTHGEICLLVYESASSAGAAICAKPADFTAHGLTIGFNKYQVVWDGRDVSVFSPYGS